MIPIKLLVKFQVYVLKQAIRHPRTPVTYLYCPDCKLRLPPNERECPICHKKPGNTPEYRQESPIPWWGSVLVMVIGVACWCLGARFG